MTEILEPPIAGMLKKAAEFCGFTRDRYREDRIPTDAKNITVVPFFGDIRSIFVLSSLILHRIRSPSKYLIVASYPGFQALFPYADEYWSINDEPKKFYSNSSKFRNNSVAAYYRSLNQYFFEDVVTIEELRSLYERGLTDLYWEKFKNIRRFLPGVPSQALLGKEFNKELNSRGGYKVFVYPSLFATSWQFGDVRMLQTSRDFWLELLNKLVENKYTPVVYKSYLTHDVSGDLLNKCIYTNEKDVGKTLSVMRATGCVLDVFNGISRLALAARCPFVAVDERNRYTSLKEYEIDDLCGTKVPKQYIFSFPTIIENMQPDVWLIGNIISRLEAFLPGLNRDEWAMTGEINEVVSYKDVRKKEIKKLGLNLLKIRK